MPSLRQSEKWSNYLKTLGWEIVTTKKDNKLFFLKSIFGSICKIQRPKIFDIEELIEIEEIAAEKKSLFIKIEPGDGQPTDILKNNGYYLSSFPLSPPATLFIDLEKSEEDLWKDVSHSGKYSIKRAQREGNLVKYLRKPDDESLQKFYKIVVQTGKRGRFYVQPYKDLETKRNLFKDNCVLIEVYNREENLISAKLYLGDGPYTTYVLGGTSELGRKEKGGYELMWKSILYLKGIGYKKLDLEGIDDSRFPGFTKDWGGFSHFKEKFGGIRVDFPLPYIKLRNPLLKFMAKIRKLPL